MTKEVSSVHDEMIVQFKHHLRKSVSIDRKANNQGKPKSHSSEHNPLKDCEM